MPTPWLYSGKDQSWSPKLLVEWFEAFKEASGRGEFVALPPVPDNEGHHAFSSASQHRLARVNAFLNSVGYPPRR